MFGFFDELPLARDHLIDDADQLPLQLRGECQGAPDPRAQLSRRTRAVVLIRAVELGPGPWHRHVRE